MAMRGQKVYVTRKKLDLTGVINNYNGNNKNTSYF